jgi:hypothetical protein
MLLHATLTSQTMKRNSLLFLFVSSLVCIATALGQSGPVAAAGPVGASPAKAAAPATSAQSGEPVSYASVTQLNGMLGQLEATSKNAQADLAKLRIERWKTDGATKKQSLANVDSIQRNLQDALPAIIAELRAAPEDLPATFKLYRNLDALYDVLGTVVEGTGAFGSKDDLQAVANDLSGFEATRKQLAQRMESLSSAKEAEIVRLRTDLKTAQAAVPAAPPKKTVVDDNAPAKKPVVKKKPVTKPAAGQTQAPAAAPAVPTKPQ